MTDVRPAVGVDVGGTKVAAGLVSPDGTVDDYLVESTPESAADIPRLIAEIVGRIIPAGGVQGVGVGAAGFVAEDRSTVRFAPNIDWVDMDLGAELQRLLGLQVVVENDANAAAWGEFRFGAGAGVEDLLMVTIGTGVGGGIVQGGRLVRGGSGAAAEVGHLRVVPGGRQCGCGQAGCLEQYASGSALVAEARRRLGDDSLTGPDVTERAQQGDPAAIELFAEIGAWAGQGIASMAAILDPALVVIGGGVSHAGDLLLDPLRAAFADHLTGAGHRPTIEVRRAGLGNQAGLVGSADLTRFTG